MKSIRELLLSTGVEGLKGVLEMFKVLLEEARSVPPGVFFKKSCSENFWGNFQKIIYNRAHTESS